MKNIDVMSSCRDLKIKQQIIDLLYSCLLDIPTSSSTLSDNQILEVRCNQMCCCLNPLCQAINRLGISNKIFSYQCPPHNGAVKCFQIYTEERILF